MCGEKPNRWPWTATLPGSPPRVRGKEYSRAPTYQPYGITPACAGKRKACVPLMSRDRDHPRVCGEKAAYLRAVWVPKGSPPRVRGKVSHAVTAHLLPGITPACAGKSRIVPGIPVRGWDHPRVCGEKLGRLWQAAHNTGSPPRVRGKGVGAPHFACDLGITPACAGKRLSRGRRSGLDRDHPRVCGEKRDIQLNLAIQAGSPPRVRGKGAG